MKVSIYSIKKEEISNLLFWSCIPAVLTIIIGVFLNSVLVFLKEDIELVELVVIWASMILAMCIVPTIALGKEFRQLLFSKICNYKLHWIDFVLVCCAMILLCILSMIDFDVTSHDFFQNIPISFAEEFWTKTVLFFLAKKVLNNNKWIILVSAGVFAFVTHINCDFLSNLMMRLPMGLLTACLYQYTNRLTYPVLIHFLYNVIFA